MRVIVVGCGIFGITAALELTKRGHRVVVCDDGPLPHPHAASTDVSKLVRGEYGTDDLYAKMMKEAFSGWREWNHKYGQTLFHEDGVLMLAGSAMKPGGFEYESYKRQKELGYHRMVRLEPGVLNSKFPEWNAAKFPDGFFNPEAGYAESSSTVTALVEEARRLGVTLHEERVTSILRENGAGGIRATGVQTKGGAVLRADLVLVAAGAWTPLLLPHLRHIMWPSAHDVMLFKPLDPERFLPPKFCSWAGDIANTGFYGFPLLKDGILKVACHDLGRVDNPDTDQTVAWDSEMKVRHWLRDHLPAAANAPLLANRVCYYCDSFDSDFFITHDKYTKGLVIASGGSGHGFKFAPIIGTCIADVVEHRFNPYTACWAWREPADKPDGTTAFAECARYDPRRDTSRATGEKQGSLSRM